jgi:hypothetical protein
MAKQWTDVTADDTYKWYCYEAWKKSKDFGHKLYMDNKGTPHLLTYLLQQENCFL